MTGNVYFTSGGAAVLTLAMCWKVSDTFLSVSCHLVLGESLVKVSDTFHVCVKVSDTFEGQAQQKVSAPTS
jgi:hypothetical protein